MHGLTGGSWKRSRRLPRQLPTLLCELFWFVLGWDAKELRTDLTRGDSRRNADDGDERRVAEAVRYIEASQVGAVELGDE